MLGYNFSKFVPGEEQNSQKAKFDQLLDIFNQLITMSAGDVAQALSWLTQIDQQHNLTDDSYGIANFIEDLKAKGYLKENPGDGPPLSLTAKGEQKIRKQSLDEIFGRLRKSPSGGNHRTPFQGPGDELNTDRRAFEFGDGMEQIAMTESLRNAQINNGLEQFSLTERDLEIQDREYQAQTSTVLMIDISHSMILYGEDRITPAKKVAMALSELIMTKYPKDTLDIIVFGNDAWQIQVKDLPYLEVGPYHTNTVAGLQLAMDLLRRRKNKNKQIFMITDGKPTCLKEGLKYYQNSWGLDRKILSKTLNLAAQCRRLKIPVTTFMIARDQYLKAFVEEFTKINQGKAYYSSLKGLGEFIFEDYESNRKRNLR
jgi:Ca-activated chloride channel homolog